MKSQKGMLSPVFSNDQVPSGDGKGLWRGNLALFAVFNGFLVRLCNKHGKFKGKLNSSGKSSRMWRTSHVVVEPIG